MPQPFRGSGLTFGHGKVMERPELAAHIGNIVGAWTHLEDTMVMIFAQALRASIEKSRQSHHVTDGLSWQIFDSLYVISQKIALIKKALSNLDDKSHLERFDGVTKEIRKCNDARNDIVHNMWGTSRDHPDALILSKRDGKRLVYKCHDFVDLARRMRETMLKLIEIMSAIPHWKTPSEAGD
jgi:hypothetical protein